LPPVIEIVGPTVIRKARRIAMGFPTSMLFCRQIGHFVGAYLSAFGRENFAGQTLRGTLLTSEKENSLGDTKAAERKDLFRYSSILAIELDL